MRFQDLQKVKKDGAQAGSYQKIFVQGGRTFIKNDFIRRGVVEQKFVAKMISWFDSFNGDVLREQNSCSMEIGTGKVTETGEEVKESVTVYHISQGKREEDSLSVFYRVYATEVDGGGVFIPQPQKDMYNVNYIKLNADHIDIKLKRGKEAEKQARVSMGTNDFTMDDGRYCAIMEIVGVGSHRSHTQRNDTYELYERNEKVFPNAIVTL